MSVISEDLSLTSDLTSQQEKLESTTEDNNARSQWKSEPNLLATTEDLPSHILSTEVTIGHVLELLLSAACLHKKASSTISVLLGGRDANVKTVDSNYPSSNICVSSQGASNPNAATTSGQNSSAALGTLHEQSKETTASSAEIWSRILENPATSQPDKALKILQDIVNGGLLDSILPYVVSSLNLNSNFASNPFPSIVAESQNRINPSSPPPSRKVSENVTKKISLEKNKENKPTKKNSGDSRRNSEEDDATLTGNQDKKCNINDNKPEITLTTFPDTSLDKGPPIVIHVCDEAHGLRQDFTCPRDLLINHIGYFADVTAGQRLEDVDISVHCDVSIFDWLLRWVKKHESPTAREPFLEPKNAISILISADFLKMSPLTEEVLRYVHSHTNQILEAQVNLSCLTDSLLTRLSRLYTHWELENIKDPRDKLQNKLYARFVQSLCEVHPIPSRGIYRTAATIYKCSDCHNIVSKSVEKMRSCVPSNSIVTTSGSLYFVHSRDINWSLTEHLKQLKNDLKTWRLVYWQLWGQVHFLPCSTCGAVFQGTEMKMCRHHRLDPTFGVESLSPVMSNTGDTYPCCGARALRFSPLPLRNGCQFSEHTVQLTRRHQEIWGPIPQIYDDLLTYQVLICNQPPPQVQQQQKVVWKGVPIVPSMKIEKSFLERSWLGEHRDKSVTTVLEPETPTVVQPKITEIPVENSQDIVQSTLSEEDTESSDDEEEGMKKRKRLLPPKFRSTMLRKALRAKRTVAYEMVNDPGWRWDTTRSTRHNQDAQRDREVRVLRELTAWLSLAPPSSSEAPLPNTRSRGRLERGKKEYGTNGPDPGLYYRIEAEFKEKFGAQEKSHNANNPGGLFRAKVQAISRIKMRLRHRAAFSATR